MAPPPELIHDAIAEILLRLPPDDPASLVSASVVCKLWRRILSHPTFPHRYREFHRTPPLLGFVRSSSGRKRSRFVPIKTRTPFLQRAFGFRRCRALDCRHGRVIFDAVCDTRESLIPWDPITGDDMLLSDPDPRSLCRSGVVPCAAAGCNHRGCSRGVPFLVVFVTTSYNDDTSIARAWLYSSVSAAWSVPTSVQIPDHSSVQRKRAAIVGDQLHFLLDTSAGILKYDIGKQCLTTIESPAVGMYTRNDILMTMEDGSSLGFVSIMDSTLHLWARKMNPNGSMGWVQDKVILLNNIVPIFRTKDTYNVNVIGFAEGLDILLLGKCPSSFMFSLKSGKFTKLSNNKYDYEDVFPYINFYIPDFASCKLPLPAETNEA